MRMPRKEIQRKSPRAGRVMSIVCTAEFSRFVNSITDPAWRFLSADPTVALDMAIKQDPPQPSTPATYTGPLSWREVRPGCSAGTASLGRGPIQRAHLSSLGTDTASCLSPTLSLHV